MVSNFGSLYKFEIYLREFLVAITGKTSAPLYYFPRRLTGKTQLWNIYSEFEPCINLLNPEWLPKTNCITCYIHDFSTSIHDYLYWLWSGQRCRKIWLGQDPIYFIFSKEFLCININLMYQLCLSRNGLVNIFARYSFENVSQKPEGKWLPGVTRVFPGGLLPYGHES